MLGSWCNKGEEKEKITIIYQVNLVNDRHSDSCVRLASGIEIFSEFGLRAKMIWPSYVIKPAWGFRSG